jgi:hypothetical protein
MKYLLSYVLAPVLVLALAGCEEETTSLSRDGGPTSLDGAVVREDAMTLEMPDPLSFVADTPGAGAAIYLRGTAAGEVLTVEVLARDIADLHGVALRLEWDPSALALATVTRAAAWFDPAIDLSKQGTPGQLAIVWSERGPRAGLDARSELTLGTLVFDALEKRPTSLAFRVARSGVVDRRGAAVAVSFAGGAVPPR